MFGWLKSHLGRQPEPAFEQRFGLLWKELVPNSGEAETLQGEIIRSVGGLEDEYNRNGNVNWEPGGYHCEYVEFLKRHLADPGTFDSATVNEIRDAAEQVRLAAEDLDTEAFEGETIQVQKHNADEAFKVLMVSAVEWCKQHPQPIRKQPGQDFWIVL